LGRCWVWGGVGLGRCWVWGDVGLLRIKRVFSASLVIGELHVSPVHFASLPHPGNSLVIFFWGVFTACLAGSWFPDQGLNVGL